MGKININYNFRKAEHKDRDEMLQICDELGQDYLPRVIDNWLNINHGGFYLLEDVDKDLIVAFCILKFSTPDQAWLAGMRVRADYQNLGAGSELTGRISKQGGAEGARYVRLATTFDNYPAQKVAEKHGFYKQSQWRVFFNQEFPDSIKGESQDQEKTQNNSVIWQEFDPDKLHRAVTGEFESKLESGRRMLFTTDFIFLGLNEDEVTNLYGEKPLSMAVLGEDKSMVVFGHETLGKEEEPVFAINRILFQNESTVTPKYTIKGSKSRQLEFSQLIKSLLIDLKSKGYWGFTIAFPYNLWEQYFRELTQFLPSDEGASFYLMERYFSQ